jgi:hypothetical protein
VKFALLSTEKVTGIPLSACPDDVVAVAVAVTFCAPSLLIVGELSCSDRFAAVVQAADDAAEAATHPELLNGEVPALPPPPPHPMIAEAADTAANAHLRLFITSLTLVE